MLPFCFDIDILSLLSQCHKVRDVECKNVVERSGTDFLQFDEMQKIRLAAPFLHSKPPLQTS